MICKVLKNIDIDDRYFFLKTDFEVEPKAGQFYMLDPGKIIRHYPDQFQFTM